MSFCNFDLLILALNLTPGKQQKVVRQSINQGFNVPRCFGTDFLREDTMIGISFLRVAAHDDDYSTNAAISYSMSKEQPEYLRVNPVTGWVYVNQPISQVRRAAEPVPSGTQASFEVTVTTRWMWNPPCLTSISACSTPRICFVGFISTVIWHTWLC